LQALLKLAQDSTPKSMFTVKHHNPLAIVLPFVLAHKNSILNRLNAAALPKQNQPAAVNMINFVTTKVILKYITWWHPAGPL